MLLFGSLLQSIVLKNTQIGIPNMISIKGRFQNFKWDRAEKSLLKGFGIFIFLFVIWFGYDNARRNFIPYKITLAAGRKGGASYILSEALARVARNNTNIKIDVCETDGTEDNIRSLKDEELKSKANCLSGKKKEIGDILKADLGTAQADIYPGADTRIVTNLYQDHFQLLVNPKKIKLPPNIEDFNFEDLRGLQIHTPPAGGQYTSFKNIAEYFNIKDNVVHPYPNKENADAIFKVRILGNEKIRRKIEKGWKLLPIKQVDAMKQTKYPAYLASKIPQGIYQGSPPVPKVDLETIAVQRNLLARKKHIPWWNFRSWLIEERQGAPDWVIEKITQVLNENRQEIKEVINKIAQERKQEKRNGNVKIDNTFDPETIFPLLNLFERPENSDVQIHQGALIYYDRQNPSFIQENADFLALILTLILLIGSWLLRVRVWRDQLKEREANEKVERYIEEIVDLMTFKPQDRGFKPKVHEIISVIENLFQRLEQLSKKFQKASHSLDEEEITQSGFRAFSEAYKSAREVIEQAIQDNQRKIISSYALQLKELLNRLDRGESPNSLLQELDKIRNEATDKLLQERIFSRQSFQTFVETYNFVRDAIERSRKV